jgi:hypothetical protein
MHKYMLWINRYSLKKTMEVKNNSKHLTRLIAGEVAYCVFIFIGYHFLQKHFVIHTKAGYVYYGVLILIPLAFNLIHFLRYKKQGNFGKSSNFFIVQIIVLLLMRYLH